MKEKDNSMETQILTLGDELLRAMFEDIRKNTEATSGNTTQLGQLSGTIGELVGLKERMETLEKEMVSTKEVVAAVKGIVDRPGIPAETVEGLRSDLSTYRGFFERPSKKVIHHVHFAGKPIVVIIVLAVAVVASWTLTGVMMVRAERYNENDIKWRYAKLITDSVLLQKLDGAEMKYQENPDEFRSYVTGEEQRRRELVEKLLEEQGKREEIDELRKKAKQF
jgi:hypothetical protein